MANSFVASRQAAEQGKLNKARDENAVTQLIKEGATPQQAAAMVAQQYYNRETSSSVHDPLAPSTVRSWNDQFTPDEITLSNGADNFKFFTGGVSTAEHANNLLSLVRSTLGDNEFANFSYGHANNVLTAKVNGIATLRAAEERGYFNAHQAYTLRKASFTGFDGIMTDADRWGAVSTQTKRWGQEDTSKILAGMAAVTFAPMMAADLLAVGAFAARGGMALGRFSLEGVNNVGRMMYSQYQAHGARGMLLNAGYSTNGLSLEVAKYASLKSAQRTAGYVMRNPLPTFEAGFKASSQFLGTALTNTHIQAGLINGTTNTAADIIFNGFVNGKPEDINLTASFISGVAGGFVGSRLAAFSPPSIKAMMGGIYGSALTEGTDQTIKWITEDKDFSLTDIAIATAAGGAAGKFVGAGLANYRQTMKTILPSSVTISTIFDETAADTIGNYFNNSVSTWWNNN